MLIGNGTYGAAAREAAVYENEKGNLVVCFNFLLSGQANEILLKGYASIAKADGTVNTKAIDNLKQVFGWDGHDPFWLVDTDLSGIPVELVIENELAEDGKTYARVKWINKPGSGGGQMPEMADRRSILTKYGAKFRALSGGAMVKVGGKAESGKQKAEMAPPRMAVTPALPGMPEVPKAPAKPTRGPTSTMEKCWQVLCEANPGAERSVVEKLWFDAIAELFPQKEQCDFGPEDWGKLELKLSDNVPY